MKKPLSLAHRGFSGNYPENTKLAFLAAIQTGCDGFESDVHLSSDGEPVIIHDPVLNRTTSGNGAVGAHTFKELRQLDCGSWKDPQFKGQQMLHLDELIELILEYDLVLNLEIKNYEVFYQGIEQKVINRIHAYNAKDKVFLSSFNHISMRLCKGIDPDIQTGFLYEHPFIEIEKYASHYPVDALHPKYGCLRYEPDLADRIHKAGYKLHTWTVNDRETIEFCIRNKVDSIISNYPDLLVQVIDEAEEGSV